MSAANVIAGAARWCVEHGDCRVIMGALPDACVDAVVTDPPYELAFMGRKWDASGIAYDVAMWREVLRVLKPGGHVLAFGGTRTSHRMTCAIEDAGFTIRDAIQWIYGSGFPKSLNVSKAVDAAAGAARPVEAIELRSDKRGGNYHGASESRPPMEWARTSAASAASAAWDGWGTALKPSHEPVVLARKPLVGTVAANVQAYGTGALNVDACRVGDEPRVNPPAANKPGGSSLNLSVVGMPATATATATDGRWPPNTVFTHSVGCGATCADDCPVRELDAQSGVLTSGGAGVVRATAGPRHGNAYGTFDRPAGQPLNVIGDTGTASRFFPVFRYEAKPSRGEREAGLREAGLREAVTGTLAGGGDGANDPVSERFTKRARNTHPTVKPIDLMRWLVRLVTRRGGIVLDPFAGSGTTGAAAMLEHMRFIGCEQDAAFVEIACGRIASWDSTDEARQLDLLGGAA